MRRFPLDLVQKTIRSENVEYSAVWMIFVLGRVEKVDRRNRWRQLEVHVALFFSEKSAVNL